MKRIYWIFPDRSSSRQRDWEWKYFWEKYREIAWAAGLKMDVVSAEALEIIYKADGTTLTLVNGQEVRPEDTIFVTELPTFPHQHQETLRSVTLFWNLKGLGFYLPIPPDLSIIMNDKMSTYLFFQRSALPVLPSIRIQTGRDLDDHDLLTLLTDFSFPLVVKPASWGGGLGINIARSLSDLRGLLGLASGSEGAMIVQPALIPETLTDFRVYFIDSLPHTVLARRPQSGEVIANLSRGGRTAIEPLPEGLHELAVTAGELINLPYCCIDFLSDGERFWLSEVELDGGTPYVHREASRELLKARFQAYARAHDAWLRDRSVLS